ncbi:MAG TPA: hypothetical protein VL947_04315 [Cytophagales bacterium]|nr:hypothetical protein [Cytophagales bacterium]
MQHILLRHLLATIAYRLTKALDGVDQTFLGFEVTQGTRSPYEIIHHMAHVVSYAISVIEQKTVDVPIKLGEEEEVVRFYELLKVADAVMVSYEIPLNIEQKLVQGPLSDVLTHIGQISMLRRLHGSPLAKENFMKAQIEVGNVSRESQQLASESDH